MVINYTVRMQVGAGPPAILPNPPAKFGLAGTCRGPFFCKWANAGMPAKPSRHWQPSLRCPPRPAWPMRAPPR